MKMSKTVVSLGVAIALMTGCKQQQEDTAVAAPSADQPATTSDTVSNEVAQAPAPDAGSPAAVPTVPAFDITAIKTSDTPLPEWPYIALPAGYHYDNADDIAGVSKDLARVPVWTGTELLWLEGKTFSDNIENDEGKSFSKFEVRKNLQLAVEALGGTRLADRTFDDTVYKANEKDIEEFRQEFSDIRDAYWADNDADTYIIRRPDTAIWIVTRVENNGASLMVAQGPLPAPPAK